MLFPVRRTPYPRLKLFLSHAGEVADLALVLEMYCVIARITSKNSVRFRFTTVFLSDTLIPHKIHNVVTQF